MSTRKAMEDKQYEDTPRGWADKWKDEFAAAKPQTEKFHKAADKVFKIFLGEIGLKDDRVIDEQLNLYYANIVTLQSIIFGNLPKAEVDRTFADANDESARVAAEILERMLNQDIQDPGNDFRSILEQSISDRLIPGLGCGRVKYDCTIETREIPNTGSPAINHPTTGQEIIAAVPAQQEEYKSEEWVDTIYTHWKDFKWSPTRTHAEIRWKAFRSYMTKAELEKRFGPPPVEEGQEDEPPEDEEGSTDNLDINAIPMTSKGPFGKGATGKDDVKQVVPQAEVWEIWNKDDKKVYWYVEDFDQILDVKDDPLELRQFWPDAPPMIANATTNRYMPKSDYAMAQDLYASVDVLQQRISRLTEACKLVGVYDKSNDEIKRLFQEGVENQLIPVDNWAMFAEKGGLEGTIQWLPIEAVTTVIKTLTELQQAKIQQLYELTGMADILRGASQQAYTSAEETKAKTLFASVRVQKIQNEFAEWVATLQNLKAEIICKHFSPENIIKQSNIMMTMDGGAAQNAITFMQRDDSIQFRIRVQPESMAMADYAQLKQDRTDFLQAISQFMQSAQPLIQMDQGTLPLLLQLLRWGLAGFKGAQEIQGIMDQAVKAATNQAKQPKQDKPDPKLMAIQAETQAKIQILQEQAKVDSQNAVAKQTMELERAQADHQAYLQGLQQQQQLAQQKFENEMEILKAQLVVNLAKLTAQQKADTSSEAIKMIHEAETTRMQAASDTHSATLDAAMDNQQSQNKIDVAEHAAGKSKEVATHAAKVQAKSKDTGNGASK